MFENVVCFLKRLLKCKIGDKVELNENLTTYKKTKTKKTNQKSVLHDSKIIFMTGLINLDKLYF